METQKALFMGRITAGVTHEIKNVLAIIKESVGLIEDLMTLCKEGSQPPAEKVLKSLNRIIEQVNRGVELSTRLNEFAHTPDQNFVSVGLNAAVEKVVSLSQRFARLKRIRLEALKTDNERMIVTDPLSFLMLLFSGIELLMDVAGEKALISVEPSLAPGELVKISGFPADKEIALPFLATELQSKCFQQMQDLSACLGMTVGMESCPPRVLVCEKTG